jgi:hypothetical protein
MFSSNFAILVIIFEEMMVDFSLFIMLLGVFVVGGTFLFYGLFQCGWISTNDPEDGWSSIGGPMLVPIMSIFANFNSCVCACLRCSRMPSQNRACFARACSRGHSDGLAQSRFDSVFNPATIAIYAYSLLGHLAMVNLLIARFSDTYIRGFPTRQWLNLPTANATSCYASPRGADAATVGEHPSGIVEVIGHRLTSFRF